MKNQISRQAKLYTKNEITLVCLDKISCLEKKLIRFNNKNHVGKAMV